MNRYDPIAVRLCTAAAAILLTGATSAAGVPAPGEAGVQIDRRALEIASAVTPAHIQRDIGDLVAFGTRHTLSDTESSTRGIGAARRWVKARFEEIAAGCEGCLDVYFQSEVIAGERRIPDPTEVVNVIAVQRGASDPERYVVMTGDIDSRASDVMDYRTDAPGANDNASGLAGVLEAARVLTRYRFPATIVYAALSGEEQGLFGGQIMARAARRQGWFIEGVLANDMIGNIAGITGAIDNTTARVFSEGTRAVESAAQARDRRYHGGEVDSPSRNLARYVSWIADRYIRDLDLMMVFRLDRFGRGGHQTPFTEEGYPAVRIMETYEHYDRQHQDLRVEEGVTYGDTIDHVDFDYAAKLTALNAVTLAALASAPPPPRAVTISGAVSADTTLNWQPVDGAVGYRVYWRLTTSPTWTHSRDVGNVTGYTLENTVIDNFFFGVASVAADGAQSPVVFPGPVGSFYPESQP